MVGNRGGAAITRAPKAVVRRGTGKTFAKQPKPFGRGVVSDRVPSTMDLFNVGMQPTIPTGGALKTIGGKGAVDIPTKKRRGKKRRMKK